MLGAGAAGLLLAACSSGAAPSSGSAAAASSAMKHRSGTADVAFAGSLLKVDDQVVGPGFERATGYVYTGRGGGALGIAQQIASGEIRPGVFESVGSAPYAIVGSTRVPWYVQFAASPLVIAYNPSGPDAATLRAVATGKEPLTKAFEAMGSPGFRLGRTNPATDPQGQAFVMMVELAQRTLGLPSSIVQQILGPGAATGGPGNASQIFSETSLDAHLQAGQIDAASAFRSQAVQLHLPYVSLPASISLGDPADAAAYATASVVVPAAGSTPAHTVHGKPLVIDVAAVSEPGQSSANVAAADTFISYQLSAAGRKAYAAAGYTLLPETVGGDRAAVPADVMAAVRSSG